MLCFIFKHNKVRFIGCDTEIKGTITFLLGVPCESLRKRVKFHLGLAGCGPGLGGDRADFLEALILNLHILSIQVTVMGDM